MRILIAPSILSADLGHLQDEIASIEKHADWIQVDVMDGHFVPNLSFGAPVLSSIKTKLPLDIHLMVTNPQDRLAEFAKVGAANCTFHAEAVKTTAERKLLIDAIHKTKMTVGIAINPDTPVENINDVIDLVDLVLIMSVHPGFSGQSFIPAVLPKVEYLRKAHPKLMIQMDGGINAKTAPLCIKSGANNLVAASAIFQAKDRAAAIRQLRGA